VFVAAREWLATGKKPEDQGIARQVEGLTQNAVLDDDALYDFVRDPRTKRDMMRLIVPLRLRAVLCEMHDRPTSGYLGVARTVERLRERFFWPGLVGNAKIAVQQCPTCNERKEKAGRSEGLLGEREIVTEPWSCIAIDFMTLPMSRNGNSKVVIATDRGTRMAVARPARSESAQETAEFLVQEVILKHGCPETPTRGPSKTEIVLFLFPLRRDDICWRSLFCCFLRLGPLLIFSLYSPTEICSDRGAAFIGEVAKALALWFNAKWKHTSGYNPKANGMVERFNRTLQEMLAKFLNQRGDDWEDWLPFAIWAYNTAVHPSTGESSFFLNSGRVPRMPVDAVLLQPALSLPTFDFAKALVGRLDSAQRLVREVMEAAAEHQRKGFDEGRGHPKVAVGDTVRLRVGERPAGVKGKFCKPYAGPLYRVSEKRGELLYKLANLCGTVIVTTDNRQVTRDNRQQTSDT
jgi:transposase InsO family protein